MKKLCALFALFLLLFLPLTVMAGSTGSVRVIHTNEDGSQSDITKDNFNKGDHSTASKAEVVATELEPVNDQGLWDSTVKAFQTAVTKGMSDFSYLIIDQLMSGSVTIFEETDSTASGKDGTDINFTTYSIRTEAVHPFEPTFVQTTIMYTGGFYILLALLVIMGAYIMLLMYNHNTVQFVDTMAAITGEERPYDTNMQVTASVGAGVTWIIFIVAYILISGFRNVVINAVSPHEVILPSMYADSIPSQLLSGLSSFFSALQSAMGVYGIHICAALIMVSASTAIIILMIGAVRGFVYFSMFVIGAFAMFNFIDIVNTCALSFGVQLYLIYNSPIFVTIGLICGLGLNAFIMYLLIRYGATRIGKSVEAL